jgi:hypothetical protein
VDSWLPAVLNAFDKSGIVKDHPDGSAGGAFWHQIAHTDPAGVSCLMRLLHLHLVWALQAEHSKLKGRSPIAAPTSSSSSSSSSSSRPQSLQVPCYHEQYLSAMGAPSNKMEARSAAPPLAAAAFVGCLHREAMQACYEGSSQSTSSGSSSSSSSQLAASTPRQQQQQQQQPFSAAEWHQLEAADVVPMPEQLLIVLEAALMGHPAFLIIAIDLFKATATVLQRRGCLNAAGSVLMPPVLHLLSLAVQHAVQQPQQLEAEDYRLPDMGNAFAALVADLLRAAGRCGWLPVWYVSVCCCLLVFTLNLCD